ncbi:MAG: hypothetical protein ACTSQO_00245 [Candidatus Helarchaeota archaeon]
MVKLTKFKSIKVDKKRVLILFIITLIILSPIIWFFNVAGYFFYALNEYTEFNNNLYLYYNSNYLPTFQTPNYSQLYNKSIWHGYFQRKYHLPLDTIVDVSFGGPYPNMTVKRYSGMGDSPIWTGYFIASEAFRYAITRNKSALNQINKACLGIKRLITISGEPGYLVRFAVPYNSTYINDPKWSSFFSPSHNMFNITYKNTTWWVEDKTSRDQNIGVMFGLGLAYYLLKDDPTPKAKEICDLIRTNVEMLLDYYIKVNWIIVDKNGNSLMGADFKSGLFFMGPGTVAILAFLKIGALVDPAKYNQMYIDYAVNRGYAMQILDSSDWNVNWQYYAFNLNHATTLVLLLLEKNPELKAIYQKAYELNLWRLVKYHRNAYFNLIYAIIFDLIGQNVTYIDKGNVLYPIKDMLDALQRYSNAPRRSWYVNNSGRSIIDYNGKNISIIDPKSVNWIKNYQIDKLDFIFEPFGLKLSKEFNLEKHAIIALPVDEQPVSDFQWQRSPFNLEGTGDGSWESPAIGFTLVYWMARYFNFIPAVISINNSLINNLNLSNPIEYKVQIQNASSHFNLTLKSYNVEWAAIWENSSLYKNGIYNITIFGRNATKIVSIKSIYSLNKVNENDLVKANTSIFPSNNPTPNILILIISTSSIIVIVLLIKYKLSSISKKIKKIIEGGKTNE